jgi:prevent-host-death family protein
MEPISLKEARKRLGDLVKAAEHGETVVITRRGRRVARLVPERPDEPRAGFPDLTEFRRSIKLKGKPISRTVIEMRREERY